MSRGSEWIKLDWQGLDELEQSLRDLGSDKEIRNALGATLLQAGEPMAKAARSRAPRKTGRMSETIDISLKLSRRQSKGTKPWNPDEANAYVGAKPIGPSLLLEFGTSRRHWKNGKSTGSVAAKPFMRPAFEETKNGVLQNIGILIWGQVEKAAKRIARRQAKLLAGQT